MKKQFFIILFTTTLTFIGFAQQNTILYKDEMDLAKDLIHAFNNKDQQQLKDIFKALTPPYTIFKNDILPLSNKDIYNYNEINSNSTLAADSVQYNKHAADFYSSYFILSTLNYNKNIAVDKKVYILFFSKDKPLNNTVSTNILQLVFDKENTVDAINLDGLVRIQGNLYINIQAYFGSFKKPELPNELTELFSKDLDIYKLENNTTSKYQKIILEFDHVEKIPAIIDKTPKTETKPENENTRNYTVQNTVQKDTDVYEIADEMPEFKGNLTKYLNEHLIRSKEAMKKNARGKVIVRFIVDANGKILNPIVLKDNVGYGCAEEALRVVSKMPKWWPGKKDGKPVKVYYTLPVTF
ncbi:MAG: energy transducer TonB [Chitinophagales bacterium]